MKKIILGLIIAFCYFSISAQTDNPFKQGDGSTIALSILIPDQVDKMPAGAASYMENKLKQVASSNGLAVNDNFGRFFITAAVFMTSKDIMPGPPMKFSMNMEVTFYIADYFDQKIFATQSLTFKGVGENETKAYISAIKNINVNNPELAKFITKGKKAIVDYYDAQCDNIIKGARTLASQREFENAIFNLTAIPDASNCYDKSLDATKEIFQQYIDFLCDVNLAKAKAAWAAKQNSEGAADAGKFLQNIYPDAKCYKEADKLFTEIKGKVLADWKFEMQKWNDLVGLESQRIQAWRDVGVAYGNGQQPTTYILPWSWRR